MGHASTITETFVQCLDNSRVVTAPYRHWPLRDVFTEDACNAIKALPFEPTSIEDTEGKRETHNSTRTFFSPESRRRFDVCGALAEALQSAASARKLEETCGITLKGSFLRVEYCQDTDGFWLEPHTDIAEKLFTMLVYLSRDAGSEEWGTDIYDEDMRHVGAAPYEFNCGLIFIPGANTWHGFRKRPIEGVRKLVIINYVVEEWRARHELSFPNQAVG